MHRSSIVLGALLLAPSVASAEHALKASGTAGYGDFVAGPSTIDDLQFARQVLPPGSATGTGTGTVAVVAQSKVIYLNKNGVTLTPGNNDSRTNKSTIATATTSIAPWAVSATTWTSTVSCMKELFAAYDVTVTDVDPGQTPHIEAVFGGSPGQLGLPQGVAGVSPFTTDCSIIENSIVFTFTDVIPQDARLACEIMAQEVAHSYGLDHELLAADPMTYLNYNGNRSFQNMTASCGEDTARPCGINGQTCRTNQNSVTLLRERLGTRGGDITPPTVSLTYPANNATVPPGFQVKASATDNMVVSSAKLYIDGTMADMQSTGGPYVFTTPTSLSNGAHVIKVEVSDGANVQGQTINVTVQQGATPPPDNTGGGTGGGDQGGGDITGGCAAGGSGAGLLLGLALVGLVRRRR